MQSQPAITFAIAPLTHVVVRSAGAEATPSVATATSRKGNPTELRASRRGHRGKAEAGAANEATRGPGEPSALDIMSGFEFVRNLVRSPWPGREASRVAARRLHPCDPIQNPPDSPSLARRKPPHGTSGLRQSHHVSGEVNPPDFRIRLVTAKRRPSPGDDLICASVSVPCRVRFAAFCPDPGINRQTRPLTCDHLDRLGSDPVVGLEPIRVERNPPRAPGAPGTTRGDKNQGHEEAGVQSDETEH